MIVREIFSEVFEWLQQDFYMFGYRLSFWGILVAGCVLSVVARQLWFFLEDHFD